MQFIPHGNSVWARSLSVFVRFTQRSSLTKRARPASFACRAGREYPYATGGFVIGRTVSHYKILSQLGSGGMGVVYEAEDTRLGRHVALKLLSSDACCDPQAMDRFFREARIVSSLSHPHICTLYDIGEHEQQQFMVMELLEGESLKGRVSRGPLPIDEVLDLGTQIADALDAAHSHGVIHRDIKPANLFVTHRGLAKVLDFGIAKLAESGPQERPDLDHTYAATEKTTVGSAVGTVAYMSPEQARGQDIDARSDLFSFGEVLYEMATGKPAFAGPTPAVIFEGILTKQPPPPSHVNGDVPPEFDRIIAKALEKDRETRYQSAAELRADLKRLKRETETGNTVAAAVSSVAVPVSKAPAPGRRRANRFLWVGAPVATLGVIAAALLWQSQQTPALAERDTVVLADFRNRTGDAMFDDTLNEALGVQLRQSPFLNVLAEQQVQATMRLMGREPMEPLTPEIATEVCQRSGGKAMLVGTVSGVGSRYLLTLSAQDCQAGTIVAEEAVEAENKDAVLGALGQAAAAFREKLGESLASVQKYDQKIEQATTTSLEALKAYSQGTTTRRTHGDRDSVPFFRRAIELDPDFALAHARLGTVLSNLGDIAEAEAASRRAYELRDKVSERERLYIVARYHTTVDRDQDKAIEAYRLLLATYPDDYAANSNLGTLYRNQGRNTDALHHLEEAVRLAPMQPLGHFNLGGAYFDEGRFDAARREWEEMLRLQEHVGARMALVRLGTFIGDNQLVERHLTATKSAPLSLDVLGTRVDVAVYQGRMREAARLAEDLIRELSDQNRLSQASENVLSLAIFQATTGRLDAARALRDRILSADALGEGAWDELVALAAVMGDRAVIAQYLEPSIKRLQSNVRRDDQQKAERAMRAIAAFGNGRYQEAYDLTLANGVDASQRNGVVLACMSAVRLEHWDDAVRMCETYIAFGPRLGLTSNHALARILLARAHAGAGRAADARRAYEDAFRLWKDADADLPLLVEARAEYQRLTS
jgi:eukaryotic-like serine/threonine-protein kinase